MLMSNGLGLQEADLSMAHFPLHSGIGINQMLLAPDGG